jgi:excisionase family DNA binding protein
MSATHATVLEPERPLAVTVSRAASLIGVSRWTIREYAKSGKLRVKRLGRRVVVPFDALEQLVAESTTENEK